MSRRFKAYKRVQITTATPGEIIVMLYEGMIRFTNIAKRALASNLHADTGYAVERVLAIIAHLQESLMSSEAPELAPNLNQMYEAWARSLVRAQLKQDVALLETMQGQMNDMLQAWRIANQSANVGIAEGA